MPRSSVIRKVPVVATLILLGVGVPGRARAYNDCGAQTSAITSVCGAPPPICTFDDFPAYSNCSGASTIYTWDGRHTSGTRTSWTRTNTAGYQCVELALRYFYFRWRVSAWPRIGSAYQMCATHPGDVTPIMHPTAADIVPGDLIVTDRNVAACYTYADGHVAVVNRVLGTNVELINQNCSSGACVTTRSIANCALCVLHANNNVQVCETPAPPPVEPSLLPQDGLDFECQNAMRDDDVAGWTDWAPYRYKAACGLTQAATGLSLSTAYPLKHAHALLCRLDDPDTFLRTSCRDVVFDADENRGTTEYGDWDPGYYKGECAPDEYVAAISQTTNQALFSLRCCQGNVTHNLCSAVTFVDGDNFEGGAMINDWDPEGYKGECAPGRYVAGVSQRPGTGEPHSILCCGDRTSPPEDAGDAGSDVATDGGAEDVAAPEADVVDPADADGGGDVEEDTGIDGTGGEEGCGCRALGAGGSGGWTWILLACAAIGLRRRSNAPRRARRP
jgi:hypothetical protein